MTSSIALTNHTDIPVPEDMKSVAAPDSPANFLLAANKETVANYGRAGNDLTIEFTDGRSLRIEGFFTKGADYNNLVFMQEDGRWLVLFDQALIDGGDGIAEASVVYEPINDSASALALLGILGAAGIGAAIAAGSGGDGGTGPLARPTMTLSTAGRRRRAARRPPTIPRRHSRGLAPPPMARSLSRSTISRR